MAIGTAKVQQVSKASSDELLRKFAEAESDSDTETDSAAATKKAARAAKRRKVRRGIPEAESCDGGGGGGGLAERKSLLAPGTGRPRSAALRRLGISRSQLIRAREVKNRSVLGSIQKTWSKAVRGASRVFIEKHYYNSHKRLISDIA